LRKKSKIIHASMNLKDFEGSVSTPLFRNSTIIFKDYKTFLKNKKNRFNSLYYGRFKTRTTKTLEKIVSKLYESEKGIVTSSGLSAIIISLLSQIKKGDHVLVVKNCYEPVKNFFSNELTKFDITHDFYSPKYSKVFESLANKNTKVIYLESPTSLFYDIQDLDKFIKFAKSRGITTIMDNTWSTFYGCNPIRLGIDIVIESATKYFSGHSDCFCGLIACNKFNYNKIFQTKVRYGDFVSSENCFLAIRGLKTLPVRLERHFENALKVYNYMKKSKFYTKVIYPGIKENKDYKIWAKYHSIGNGLITFQIKKRSKPIETFLDSLIFFRIGFSWGGFESLILPIYEDEKKSTAETKGIWFRIHVGLEDPEDLIKDLDQALKKYLV
tara:strand:+ start:5463 stop:6614 length:1152 start_codon:yes stop_codon:yes gene_type:complete